jgi:hypothetical protein
MFSVREEYVPGVGGPVYTVAGILGTVFIDMQASGFEWPGTRIDWNRRIASGLQQGVDLSPGMG